MYQSTVLEALFRETFFTGHDTVLEGGAEEPVYRPGRPHRIHYTRDYFRSALHEVAHWCVAGARRRALEDYGYWYAPDGRDARRQEAFARVEVRPQALEALFCAACGHRFRVSMDNLNGDAGARALEAEFARAVHQRARRYLDQGLPPRPRAWCGALARHFRVDMTAPHAALERVFLFPSSLREKS